MSLEWGRVARLCTKTRLAVLLLVFAAAALIVCRLVFQFAEEAGFAQKEATFLGEMAEAAAVSGTSGSTKRRVTKMPTVAICMVGGVRSLVLYGVYESIATNLLDVIRGHASASDLFVLVTTLPQTGMGGASYENSYREFDAVETEYGKLGLKKAMERLKPAKSMIYRESDCDSLAQACSELGKGTCRCCEEPQYLQVAWRDICSRWVQQREGELGWKYDFLVHTRPDVAFVEPIEPPDLWDKAKVMLTTKGPCDNNGFGAIECRGPWNRADYFFVVPKAHRDFWPAALWSWAQQPCNNVDPAPEKFLFRVTPEGPNASKLLFGSAQFTYKAFPAIVARAFHEADCFRLTRENLQYAQACIDWSRTGLDRFPFSGFQNNETTTTFAVADPIRSPGWTAPLMPQLVRPAATQQGALLLRPSSAIKSPLTTMGPNTSAASPTTAPPHSAMSKLLLRQRSSRSQGRPDNSSSRPPGTRPRSRNASPRQGPLGSLKNLLRMRTTTMPTTPPHRLLRPVSSR